MANEEKDGIVGLPFTGIIEGEPTVEENVEPVEQVEETTPEQTEEAPVEQTETAPNAEAPEPVEAAPDTETKVFEKEEEVEPVEPIEEKPADKLAKFRKENALDEEAVASELEAREAQAAAAAQYNAMLKESPKLQLAYLETLDEKGMLNEEWRPHLEKLREGITPKKQPTETPVKQEEEKLPSLEEARAHAKKLIAEGREDEAIEHLADVKAQHKAAELRKEIEPVKAELENWKKSKQTEEQQRLQRQTMEAVQADLSAACEKFPKIMALDKQGRVQWKCKKALEAVNEVYRDWSNPNSENYRPNVSTTTIVREALIRTGRLKAGVTKKEEPKKPQAKQPIHATASTSSKPNKTPAAKDSEPGVFGVRFR